MIDQLSIIEYIYGALLVVLGALFQIIREAQKDQRRNHQLLEEKVHALQNVLSKDYVPRAELGVTLSEIRNSLVRIEQRLDGKEDRR